MSVYGETRGPHPGRKATARHRAASIQRIPGQGARAGGPAGRPAYPDGAASLLWRSAATQAPACLRNFLRRARLLYQLSLEPCAACACFPWGRVLAAALTFGQPCARPVACEHSVAETRELFLGRRGPFTGVPHRVPQHGHSLPSFLCCVESSLSTPFCIGEKHRTRVQLSGALLAQPREGEIAQLNAGCVRSAV